MNVHLASIHRPGLRAGSLLTAVNGLERVFLNESRQAKMYRVFFWKLDWPVQ